LITRDSDAWFLAAVLYVLAAFGFSGGNIFYDSLLPHVAAGDDIDRVSARGFALGYLGGGLLLVLNVAWIRWPHAFGLPNPQIAVRAAFLSVAVWWAVFSIPFFRRVPEPPVVRRPDAARVPLTEGFRRLSGTFRHIRRYRHLGLFLFAYWVYTDGIGTMFRMATAYGHEIGIEPIDMITALILIQATAIPFTFLFGRLAKVIGAKRSILLALAVYGAVSVSAYFMRTSLHFYILALAVATVQGGSQALSRSLFGRMVPRHKSAEFFGFYSTSSKFAGVFGPFVFGLISQAAGGSRLSILSVIAFFIVGAILLSRVDIEEGIRAAQEEAAPVAAA
jgi:UMF1 family MFS transporter